MICSLYIIEWLLLLSAYSGQLKKRCCAFSKPPHRHEGLLLLRDVCLPRKDTTNYITNQNYTNNRNNDRKQRTCSEVIKLFSMLNSAEHEIYILLINVKMPTFVGILTFISMINTPTKEFDTKKNLYFLALRV